jgi:uncharacterized membrane protein YkvA (DUF1232 family)
MPLSVIEFIKYFLPFLINFIRSKDVSFLPKFLVIVGSIYLISFVDLIPDIFPFIGLLDDIVIVPLLVGGGYQMVAKNIIGRIWAKTLGKTTIHPIN